MLVQSDAMNYRHAFHAGNHGDVLKHAVLARVLSYMTAKDKPMAVLDAHGGIGTYELSGVEAFKTGEWRDGIGRLMSSPTPENVQQLLAPYLACVSALNPNGGLMRYPGSPEICRRMLRGSDRLLLNELHPDDFLTLESRYGGGQGVKVTALDALQAVKANLPFAERRGVLLLDPAYEVADETDRVLRMVAHAMKRMANLACLIWYPVTTQEFASTLCEKVHGAGSYPLLQLELLVKEPFKQAGLAGSGVLVINPPWQLHDEMQVLLPFLATRLGTSKWGRGTVKWLTPPK